MEKEEWPVYPKINSGTNGGGYAKTQLRVRLEDGTYAFQKFSFSGRGELACVKHLMTEIYIAMHLGRQNLLLNVVMADGTVKALTPNSSKETEEDRIRRCYFNSPPIKPQQ